MQNARNAMPNASVVSAALQTLVYGGAASYGLYNRCAGARRRARRAKARANEMNSGDGDSRATTRRRDDATTRRRRTDGGRRANSLFNVEGGHRAIVYNRFVGVKDKVYAEGTHFMIPWVERPYVYDVRARAHQVNSQSGSRDLQMVNISIRVLTRPDATKLPEVYRTLGMDFNERVLPSVIHETVKSVVAQHNASELITKREQVSLSIRHLLKQRAAQFNMVLDDVSLTALTFGREYTAAIESKQVAQQEAERAKFVVDKARQDKLSAVIQAEGEAKSAKLIGEAIANNPAFLTLRKIEAARAIAQTMANSNNRVMLSADSLLLNLQDDKPADKK
jgi:prohibitin 2